ncbi:nose resistant to fluoxetine protein 6 isoform X2 [Leptinotarsa decemlineata]|uniref:nose resistant to fluoxetine protein 6 isoform X2 n=2 Tax=Leptinotarsa decemlineata TaxID=7539 RepID=UPI003D308E19
MKAILIFVCLFKIGEINGNFLLETVENENKIAKVSKKCRLALELSAENLKNSTAENNWALRMWDATSKVPVGLISYNFGEMGDFKQCVETKSLSDNILGKYCLGSITITNTSDPYITSENGNLQQQIYWRNLISIISTGVSLVGDPTWAICIPSNCSDDDVLVILNDMQPEFINFESVACQTIDDVYPRLTTEAIFGIASLTVVVVLMVVSTSYDIYCCSENKVPAHPALITFSTYTNAGKLFHMNKNSGELSSLNGLRFISMLWIVAVHTNSVYTSGPIFNSKDVVDFTNSSFSMIFASGNLACDTFLIVGGVLVTYVFFKEKRNEKKFNILKHYFHRYIRLTPSLAGAVLVSATLLRYMGSGPKWGYIINGFENNCKDYWWSTLLYIQNYVNVNRMCVGQSWYLNIDMQLYLFSPFILLLLTKYPKSAITVLVSATLASIGASFWTAYSEQLSGITTNLYPKVPVQTYMNDYYLKTHNRASPWLIGAMLGYYLTRDSSKYAKIPKILSLLTWICSFGVILTCVFGGHSTLRTPYYDRLGNSFYIALVRPAWALAIGWIIWACCTNRGGVVNTILSYPIFQVLNKFTYSIYILHVTSLYMIVFSQKTSIYFTVFNLAYYYWGIFMFSFGLSIIWVLAFESPMLVLEKILFK